MAPLYFFAINRAKIGLHTGYSITADKIPSKLPPIKKDQKETPFRPVILQIGSLTQDIQEGLHAIGSMWHTKRKNISPKKYPAAWQGTIVQGLFTTAPANTAAPLSENNHVDANTIMVCIPRNGEKAIYKPTEKERESLCGERSFKTSRSKTETIFRTIFLKKRKNIVYSLPRDTNRTKFFFFAKTDRLR